MIKQIIYISKATSHFDSNELNKLGVSSAQNNREFNITGILCYSSGCFIQLLEGEAGFIKALLDVIKLDRRHYDLQVILEQNANQRLAEKWSMACINNADALLDEIKNITPLHQTCTEQQQRIIKLMQHYIENLNRQVN